MVEIGLTAISATFVSGIVLGSLFALMAVGLTLVFSTVRVLNFAHGGFFALGAFLVWWLTAPRFSPYLGPDPRVLGVELPFVAAFLISIGVMFCLGLLYERSVIRPVRFKPDWETKLYFITISLLVAFENFNIWAFGVHTKRVITPIPGFVYISEFPLLSYMEILQLGIALVTLIAIYLFIKYNRHGLAMRAVAYDDEVATLLGIKLSRIYSFTFGLSAMLAGIAGVLVSNIFFVRYDVGTLPMIKAFLIIIFGGIGSIPGTILAAYVFGEVESFITLFLGASWALPAEYVLIGLFLVFRRQGLMGIKE